MTACSVGAVLGVTGKCMEDHTCWNSVMEGGGWKVSSPLLAYIAPIFRIYKDRKLNLDYCNISLKMKQILKDLLLLKSCTHPKTWMWFFQFYWTSLPRNNVGYYRLPYTKETNTVTIHILNESQMSKGKGT